MTSASRRRLLRQRSLPQHEAELMASAKPVVVVTGIAGNLGSRLLPLLGDFSVIGVDLSPPQTDFRCSSSVWILARNLPRARFSNCCATHSRFRWFILRL